MNMTVAVAEALRPDKPSYNSGIDFFSNNW